MNIVTFKQMADYLGLTAGAGVSDGDKGDITVTASGTTWTIDPAVVTLAKMANMATASIIYRKTAGTGVPEVNTLATLKTDLVLTSADVGLGSVNNTADTAKSITGDVTGTLGASVVGKINGTSMATLATGILKNTTTTGVPSIAIAADFPTLNQNTTGTAGGLSANIAESQVTNLVSDLTFLNTNKEPSITATTSADFWSGAKTFINFASTVRATVLTGLSLATSQVIAATDTVLLALGYLQAQITALTTTVAGKVASVTAGTNVTVTGTATAPIVNAPTMTATVAGVVPTPPNDSTKFLNGVGAFAIPVAAASNWPLVKNSTDVGETLTITAGFQFICKREFVSRGDVINRGELIIL